MEESKKNEETIKTIKDVPLTPPDTGNTPQTEQGKYVK